jgi:hypothetical protein
MKAKDSDLMLPQQVELRIKRMEGMIQAMLQRNEDASAEEEALDVLRKKARLPRLL